MIEERSQMPSVHLPFGDRRDTPFYNRDIVSVRQFNDADLEYIFGVAHEMKEMVARVGAFDLLKGKLLANLFYEPSTRTSSSFTAAMERLGGSVIPINEVTYSSVSKGESLPDTVRTLEAYADVIVLRHPEKGASALAAQYTKKPIINAGDGAGEHPTQALLDLFTIRQELGAVDGLTVTLVGDLKHGRTVHSLSQLLSGYDVTLNYVSPEILRMPESIVTEIAATGTPQNEYRDLDDVIAASDVVYVTRVQKERFENPADYEKVAGAYVVDQSLMSRAKEKMALLHPLPRVNEIAIEVDDDPRAAYFRQMENGMYVRMALLALVLGKA
jgi:aspartate carbamoyltransferase